MTSFHSLDKLTNNVETSTLTVDSKLASRLGFSAKEYSTLLDSHTSYEPVLEQLFIKVKGSSFKRDQSRIFKLFEQCIAYYKPNNNALIGEIPLAQISDIETYREGGIRGRYFLKLNLGNQHFNLTCEGIETIREWASQITKLKSKITNTSYFINSKNKIVACKTSEQFWKKKEKDEIEFEKDGRIISTVSDLYAYEEVSESCEKWPSKSLNYILSGITIDIQREDSNKSKEKTVQKVNPKLKYKQYKIKIDQSLGVFNRTGEVLKASIEGSRNFVFLFSSRSLKECKHDKQNSKAQDKVQKESLLGTIGTYYYNKIDRIIDVNSSTFIMTHPIGMINLKALMKKFKTIPDFLSFTIIKSLTNSFFEYRDQEILMPLFNTENVYLKVNDLDSRNKTEKSLLSSLIEVNVFNIGDFIYSKTLKEELEFIEYPKRLLKLLFKMVTGKTLDKKSTDISVPKKTSDEAIDLLNLIGDVQDENDWEKLKNYKIVEQEIYYEDNKENEVIKYLYNKN
eukprot:GAHX01001293.1.p1 GENE.GAHX01001293.1~~GAHX01001293.1.p1  ORF type:complete len:511 (-),score=118.62 GAHX01001293.1:2906-4438(-)